jgi:hypothetical protein
LAHWLRHLYSLGVTFYEMLTGTLPFTASDPMEWVHCHIAHQPPAPSKKVMGLPAQLSSIIMKLLAKTAEERYQTAGGLQADLCRCLEEWLSHGRIEPFPLGARDTSEHLLIPEKLYGREHEIETLLAMPCIAARSAILRRAWRPEHGPPLCEKRAAVLSALGRIRQSASPRATSSVAHRGAHRLRIECNDRCTCCAVRCRDGGQSLAGSVERGRAGQAHRDSLENFARACGRGARTAHSFYGQRAADCRRGDDWRRQRRGHAARGGRDAGWRMGKSNICTS